MATKKNTDPLAELRNKLDMAEEATTKAEDALRDHSADLEQAEADAAALASGSAHDPAEWSQKEDQARFLAARTPHLEQELVEARQREDVARLAWAEPYARELVTVEIPSHQAKCDAVVARLVDALVAAHEHFTREAELFRTAELFIREHGSDLHDEEPWTTPGTVLSVGPFTAKAEGDWSPAVVSGEGVSVVPPKVDEDVSAILEKATAAAHQVTHAAEIEAERIAYDEAARRAREEGERLAARARLEDELEAIARRKRQSEMPAGGVQVFANAATLD